MLSRGFDGKAETAGCGGRRSIVNRRGENVCSAYDPITGAVVNDGVHGTISLSESGFCSEEEALSNLGVKKPFDQYIFVSGEVVRCKVFRGDRR